MLQRSMKGRGLLSVGAVPEGSEAAMSPASIVPAVKEAAPASGLCGRSTSYPTPSI